MGDAGGALIHGGDLGALQPSLPNPLTSGKLSTRLDPGLRRAAPEIYQSILSEGCQSVRQWCEMSFGQQKGSDQWTELWDRSTEIDYALAQCEDDVSLLRLLGTSDALEMHLRRLASHRYRIRTGDRVGADHILAQRAPGRGSDVAPTWLVTDATTHSATEWKRSERVNKERGRGRGREGGDRGGGADGGRGRGRGKGRGASEDAGGGKGS